ncbi:conserved exported hypothetical protein [Candidatus Sulfopaludibacter sp. SbA4]|nr:conserved exported hypothetical protein [Candidatus Sulfopaludibacter sp. SbA4]
MSDTRRSFLHSTAALAAGVSGAATLMAQAPGRPTAGQAPATPPRPASEIQVPKMKFGKYEISRLICGCNPFYGFGHFNQTLGAVMQEYFTPARVREVLHQCNRFGIDTFNYYAGGRGLPDFESFLAEGGRMQLVAQGMGDQAAVVKTLKPMAIYHHGENTDRAFQNGQMETVKEWCKTVRGMGVMAGVGTHKPEVIQLVEEQGWDIDFYAGCVYNRTRTPEEWKKVLNGELVEMQGECYLQSDPARMYKVMRATAKPCFAFKILAAGRVANVDQAFRTAYESIKPTDGVFIGLFPRVKDEVRENAERVHRILVERV